MKTDQKFGLSLLIFILINKQINLEKLIRGSIIYNFNEYDFFYSGHLSVNKYIVYIYIVNIKKLIDVNQLFADSNISGVELLKFR